VRVCLGGTFDLLHKGHKALIDRAFEIAEGGEVWIGLSDGELARSKGVVSSYDERRRRLERYLRERGYGNYRIVPIYDRYGLTLKEDFDVIVVSEETFRVAKEINRLRKAKGLKEMRIEMIKMVLAEDGKPISSSRIRKGEIDEEGKHPR